MFIFQGFLVFVRACSMTWGVGSGWRRSTRGHRARTSKLKRSLEGQQPCCVGSPRGHLIDDAHAPTCRWRCELTGATGFVERLPSRQETRGDPGCCVRWCVNGRGGEKWTWTRTCVLMHEGTDWVWGAAGWLIRFCMKAMPIIRNWFVKM